MKCHGEAADHRVRNARPIEGLGHPQEQHGIYQYIPRWDGINPTKTAGPCGGVGQGLVFGIGCAGSLSSAPRTPGPAFKDFPASIRRFT
jgi:hypothetical protein